MTTLSATATAASPPPHLKMLELAMGHMRAQAVCLAARLGIADLLKNGPKEPADLARATHTHPGSLYRLLRALAGMGVFAELEDGRFELTPLAATLQSDTPDSVRDALLLVGAGFHWNSWSQFSHSVQTGECAFEHVHGMRFFEYLPANPEAGATFDAWMTRASQLQLPALVKSYSFASFKTVVDVGGGQGALLTAILKANPGLKGVLFDLPEVIAACRERVLAQAGPCCQTLSGDIFKAVPPGGDLYLLKTVIHDWDDELSTQILRRCREAMTSTARLLIIESIVPKGNEPHPGKLMDLNMLVLNHGGRERTEAEYAGLLDAAGFTISQILATPSPLSVIEARPK